MPRGRRRQIIKEPPVLFDEIPAPTRQRIERLLILLRAAIRDGKREAMQRRAEARKAA